MRWIQFRQVMKTDSGHEEFYSADAWPDRKICGASSQRDHHDPT
jgi:hypothetical protein